MSSIFITAVCYKSKTLKDGTNPIMLRICKDRKKKYISLGISVSAKFWDFKRQKPKSSCPNKDNIERLIDLKTREYKNLAIEMSANSKSYTPNTLADKVETKLNIQTVGEFYDKLISDYLNKGKYGNALVYATSKRCIQRFTHSNLSFTFDVIDPKWLLRYEEWMKESYKETTVSLRFRTLRSVFNKAIEMEVVKKDLYPFDKFKVSKFNTSTKKRAISKDDIRKIEMLDLSSEEWYMRFSRDLFIFSYYCAGINYCDIALLTFSQIKNDRLSYYRHKTFSRSKMRKEISFALNSRCKEIIQAYCPPFATDDDYVFPILDRKIHVTELQKRNRMHKVQGKVNHFLKIIAERAGLQSNLSMYVARHTFATVMKRSNVNIALISDLMGHSSISTTQIYLDSFENSQIDKAMENL